MGDIRKRFLPQKRSHIWALESAFRSAFVAYIPKYEIFPITCSFLRLLHFFFLLPFISSAAVLVPVRLFVAVTVRFFFLPPLLLLRLSSSSSFFPLLQSSPQPVAFSISSFITLFVSELVSLIFITMTCIV